jgi:uncharacterized sulfatase
LFNSAQDPACLTDLAAEPVFAETKVELSNRLTKCLKQTGDPRVVGDGDIWENYPRSSPIRKFPPPETQPRGALHPFSKALFTTTTDANRP